MNHNPDKIGLVAVTILCIAAITLIAYWATQTDKLDPNASTLLGAIVAGLIATAGASLQALRGMSMGAALTKVTDQLAASVPTQQNMGGEPSEVRVVNPPEDPVHTEESRT